MSAKSVRKLFEQYTTKFLGVNETTWSDFEFHDSIPTSPDSSFLFSTDIRVPCIVIFCYCIAIPISESLMRYRSPFSGTKWPLFIHNILLSLISLYLTIFMGATVLSYDTSYEVMYCGLTREQQKGTLNWLYFINLLVKYYELSDTLFLVIKKKPISFLHGYHHPNTLLFAWIIIMESPGMQWTVLILNLFVHTVMYLYYAMSAIRIRMPCKVIITVMQIVQFVLDLIFVFHNWYDINFNPTPKCYATNVSAYTAMIVLGSYLLLFVDFFIRSYCKKKVKIGDGSAAKWKDKKNN